MSSLKANAFQDYANVNQTKLKLKERTILIPGFRIKIDCLTYLEEALEL